MKKSIRLALIAGACFLGLAFAAPAFSAYNPSLIMEQSSYKLGGATTADVFIAIDPDADPTAKLTIFSPIGYTANLTAAPGHQDRHRRRAREGQGDRRSAADARRRRARGESGRPGDPGRGDQVHRQDDAQHDLGPEHQPAGADRSRSRSSSTRSARSSPSRSACLRRTFRPRWVARSSARSCSPADFTIKNVFTNAGATGGYEWSGIFTPYTPGTSTPNPAGTVEARTLRRAALVADAQAGDREAGLQARRPAEDRRRQPEAAIKLDLYCGQEGRPRRRTPSPAGPASASRAAAKLPASGKYSIARPNVKFATFFQTRFENYTTACTGPSPSGLPVPCREERIAAITSNQLKVLKPKPKKKHR